VKKEETITMKNCAKWLGILSFAAMLVSANGVFAASRTLNVLHSHGKTVQGSWDGGDTVPTSGGNGQITLEAGVAKTAVLKVQCNSKQGYSVSFNTPNATSDSASKMLLDGVGGSAQEELDYTVTLDVEQFRATSNITVETLLLQTVGSSVVVDFLGAGTTVPNDPSEANEVKLLMTLTPFDPFAKEEGDYTDTVTAEVTLN